MIANLPKCSRSVVGMPSAAGIAALGLGVVGIGVAAHGYQTKCRREAASKEKADEAIKVEQWQRARAEREFNNSRKVPPIHSLNNH